MPPFRHRQDAAVGSKKRLTVAAACALLLSFGLLASRTPEQPVGDPMTAEAQAQAIVLRSGAGHEAHILRRGAAIQRLLVPDASGQVADVVLGFDDEAPYKVGLPVMPPR